MTINAIKIMLPAIMTFLIGYLAAPYYIQYLLKNNFIKRKFINKSLDGSPATITEKIHGEAFKGTPRLGGVLIWFSVSIVLFI